jgi:hypothetical protein
MYGSHHTQGYEVAQVNYQLAQQQQQPQPNRYEISKYLYENIKTYMLSIIIIGYCCWWERLLLLLLYELGLIWKKQKKKLCENSFSVLVLWKFRYTKNFRL